MLVRVPNVHRVVAKGKVYHYHRPTKTKLTETPGSPEFLARVNALNSRKKPPAASAASLGGLLRQYRLSPQYTALKPNSKANYEKNLVELEKVGRMPISAVEGPFVIGLRDRIYAKHGRVQANQLVSLIRTIWAWGKPYGLTQGNPTEGIREIPRPKGLKIKNRRWKIAEIEAFVQHCPRRDVALAVLLSAFTALRLSDVIELRWSDYDEGAESIVQNKTGDEVFIHLPPLVRAVLAVTPRTTEFLVSNGRKAHKSSSFSMLFWRLAKDMAEKGLVGPGLTFHGLRHTVASELADMGADDRTIMSVTGHKNPAHVTRYTAQADSRKRSKAGADMLSAIKLGVKPTVKPDENEAISDT